MTKSLMTVALLGWILWFTQEESRPHLRLPSHWGQLGWFESQRECESYGQRLVEQLGRVSAPPGYTRATAAMAFLDTSQDGRRETQTTLYCMADTIDPRGPKSGTK
ncbi:MAG: hypothetical protein DME00_35390 [Candidatus Rokuibacteriota bacterium]|nr:MAG: hypothetical protein DME00_35390 [Candidatus Rokubacteria bacterium]